MHFYTYHSQVSDMPALYKDVDLVIREKNPLKYYNSNSTTKYNWSFISSFNDFSLFAYDNPQSSIQKYSAKYLFILFTNKMCSSASYPQQMLFFYVMEIMRNIW